MKQNVRVRIAPSPTGIPHIGNTRTALFNFLFARHHKGNFILRIEDTDQARIVPGAEEAIKEILTWLGLTPDEFYRQSERLDLYKKAVEELLKKGLARKDEGAVRFIVQKGKTVSWNDKVGDKHISFQTDDIEDFVILKSDGFPTYHLANVVDDHEMKISHVMRGDEWISSTPKHILLYEAFGWEPPVFAHLPVILGPDKTKLSKRHGAESALAYRDKGYLKEALINFMLLLGWTHPKQKEIFSIDEAIKLFDLKDINTNSPVFDIKKLEWMNGKYIRKTPDDELATFVWEYTKKKYPLEKIKRVTPLVKERMNKLSEFITLSGFLLENEAPIPLMITPYYSTNISGATISRMEEIPKSQWNEENLNKAFNAAIQTAGTSTNDFFMDLRGTIAGSRVTPPITESVEILGKDEFLRRLKIGNRMVTGAEKKKT